MFVGKLFKRRGRGKLPNRFRTFNIISDKRDKHLKGEIFIRHCRGHDCIILLSYFEGFRDSHIRLLSKLFFVDNRDVLLLF